MRDRAVAEVLCGVFVDVGDARGVDELWGQRVVGVAHRDPVDGAPVVGCRLRRRGERRGRRRTRCPPDRPSEPRRRRGLGRRRLAEHPASRAARPRRRRRRPAGRSGCAPCPAWVPGPAAGSPAGTPVRPATAGSTARRTRRCGSRAPSAQNAASVSGSAQSMTMSTFGCNCSVMLSVSPCGPDGVLLVTREERDTRQRFRDRYGEDRHRGRAPDRAGGDRRRLGRQRVHDDGPGRPARNRARP